MAEVPMIATGNFTYNTRRLKAGDAFPARNEMDARILERVRRVAELGKSAPAPPIPEAVEAEEVFVPTIKEVLKAKVIAPKAKPAVKRSKRRAKAKR